MNAKKHVSNTALGAGVILLCMVAIGVVTGVSQQQFELFAEPRDYYRELLAGAEPLRWIIGLDNIFIAAYSTLVILLCRVFYNDETKFLVLIFAGAGLAGGLLDYLENHHIMTMLDAARLGVVPSALEIKERMVMSMLKWHLGFFAFFLLAFAFPARTLLSRMFRFSLIFAQLPVGVFYYILRDSAMGDVLFYARYGNLALGFLLIAWFFHGKARKHFESPRMATEKFV